MKLILEKSKYTIGNSSGGGSTILPGTWEQDDTDDIRVKRINMAPEQTSSAIMIWSWDDAPLRVRALYEDRYDVEPLYVARMPMDKTLKYIEVEEKRIEGGYAHDYIIEGGFRYVPLWDGDAFDVIRCQSSPRRK